MKLFLPNGSAVTLSQRHFVASGGEGAVYALGQQAFKVYADPAKAIPAGKIAELGAIQDPCVVKPLAALADDCGRVVGYAMRFVPRTHPLCALFPRAYRDREGLTPDRVFALVRQLQTRVAAVHAAGVLVVDLNELNFLVDEAHADVYAIDVDSYQTAHYPATALMESVRDRHAPPKMFSQGTDWFSFAVVSFQLFVGIHPYKGRHPTIQGLDARMHADASVFDPKVSIPAVCYPLTIVPQVYLDWYRAVLQDGKRVAPPDEVVARVALATTWAPAEVAASGGLSVVEIEDFYSDEIRGLWEVGGERFVWAGDALHSRRRDYELDGAAVVGVVRGAAGGPPVAVLRGGRFVLLTPEGRLDPVAFGLRVDDSMTADGTAYVRCGENLARVVFCCTGRKVVAGTELVGAVLEHATQLRDGVAIQDLLGACYATLPGGGQVRLLELDRAFTGCRVVDAMHRGGVLVVLAEKAGRYDRLVFRFQDEGTAQVEYDVRTTEDVGLDALNLVVLDSGVAILHDGQAEELEVFSNVRGAKTLKRVDARSLRGMRLYATGGRVLGARGSKLYRIGLT